jgi:ATP-dependent helicase/nuclease subunit A
VTVTPPIDEVERERVRRDFDHNLIVEAGAGTGKTTLIVDRVVNALLTGRTTLDRLAVLTYLEKAADELRQRIGVRLRAAWAAETDSRRRRRLAAALEAWPTAMIGTLHSLGQRLLAQHAARWGLPPDFEVWDRVEQERQETLAFAAFLQAADPWVREGLQEGLRMGLTLEQWQSLVQQAGRLTGEQTEWGAPPESAADLLEAWTAAVAELQTVIDSVGPDPDDAGVRQVADLTRHLAAFRHLPDDMLTPHLYAWDPPAPAGNQARWGRHADALRRQKAVLKDLRDRHRIWQASTAAAVARPLVETGRQFHQFFREWRQARQAVIFDDQVERVAEALAEDPAWRLQVAGAFDAVWVDEFQDTDPRQAEMVRWLAADLDPDANPDRPPPGRLMVVGDVKQSIYRFRGADVTHIRQWTERLVAAGAADLVPITVNFRSQPAVIDTVNAVFGTLFWGQSPYDPEYRPLTAHRPDAGGMVRRVAVAPVAARQKAWERENLEADAVAAVIRQAVEEGWPVWVGAEARPVTYGDICVLFPQRTGLETYRDRLVANGIPVGSGGRRGFYRRDDVRGLAAILRAAVLPEDQTAVVGALRSAWIGISDAQLADHRKNGGRWYPRDPGRRDGAVGRALLWLADLAAAWPDVGAAGILERAVALRQAELSGDERANVARLLEEARHWAARWGTAEYARWLWDRVRQGAEGEEPEAPERDAGVQFSTVHQAKGLEWPMVVVANLGRRPGPRRDWVLTDPHAGVWAVKVGRSAMANWETVKAAVTAQEEAERRRLWYVALTRARDHLVVMDSDPDLELFQHWAEAPHFPPSVSSPERGGDLLIVVRPPEYPGMVKTPVKPSPGLSRLRTWLLQLAGEEVLTVRAQLGEAPREVREAWRWLASQPWWRPHEVRVRVPVLGRGLVTPLVIDLVHGGSSWTLVQLQDHPSQVDPAARETLRQAASVLRAGGIQVRELVAAAPQAHRWWAVDPRQ